jgi:hypothetical protein
MTLEAHKKHPADAIVMQRFDNGFCRVSVSLKSSYFSVTKKYGWQKTMYPSVNQAFRAMSEMRDRHESLASIPIWMMCLKNNWVEVSDEDEILMYVLSIS